MIRIVILFALAIGTAAAEAAIPKGATEIEPGVYKHKEASGKAFIYRKTPFGVTKSLEGAVEKAPAVEKAATPASPQATPFGNLEKRTQAQIKVVEKGDTLEFERTSPFGGVRWTNKKDQLTSEEREAWERTRATTGTGSQSK